MRCTRCDRSTEQGPLCVECLIFDVIITPRMVACFFCKEKYLPKEGHFCNAEAVIPVVESMGTIQ